MKIIDRDQSQQGLPWENLTPPKVFIPYGADLRHGGFIKLNETVLHARLHNLVSRIQRLTHGAQIFYDKPAEGDMHYITQGEVARQSGWAQVNYWNRAEETPRYSLRVDNWGQLTFVYDPLRWTEANSRLGNFGIKQSKDIGGGRKCISVNRFDLELDKQTGMFFEEVLAAANPGPVFI